MRAVCVCSLYGETQAKTVGTSGLQIACKEWEITN